MNFIHTADIHLGAAPDSTMPWAGERAAEIWDSFYRLLDEAEASETDLLLIAGDLFHRQPLKRELKEVNYRFSQLTHTKVVIIAGNHDYIGPQSYYRDFEWSSNVVFFRKNHISYIYLASLATLVYGMSYDRHEIRENMYDGLHPMRRFKDGRPVPEGSHHILLAHGGDAEHIPMNLNRLRQAGFDYIAMGHIHKPWVDDQAAMAYAGALEPIDRNDEGPHGYIRGRMDDEGIEVEFIPFAKRSYETVTIDMHGEMTMQEVAQAVRRAIEEEGKENIYQIVLDGFKSTDFELDEHLLKRAGYILSVSDRAVPDFDFERLYAENKDNIIGLYIKKITEMDISDSLKAKALCYGMKALYQMR